MNFRIPHHTLLARWLDPVAGLQIAWIVLALVLVRRTRLFVVLAVPFALAVLLTLVQVTTGSHSLALLFPWRMTAVLMPVATTIVLARLATLPVGVLDGPLARASATAAVACFAAAGVWIVSERLAFLASDEDVAVMAFVRQHKQAGDVYFLPISVPKAVRGSQSSDFKPLPQKRQDASLISADLQRFRLYSGVPIFVDFKAIPYKDVEVVECVCRLKVAEAVQKQLGDGQVRDALATLRRWNVTHLVWPAGKLSPQTGLDSVYDADRHYQVFRLTPP